MGWHGDNLIRGGRRDGGGPTGRIGEYRGQQNASLLLQQGRKQRECGWWLLGGPGVGTVGMGMGGLAWLQNLDEGKRRGQERSWC